MMSGDKCVLAYSGGLDTSAMIPYLRENHGVEVVAVLIDVGRAQELEALRRRALDAGAEEAIVIDAKEEFLSDFVLPALKANALYEEKYPLVSALSRPLIAKKLVEVARQQGASTVAHGCTAKGNDQVRFDVSIRCQEVVINFKKGVPVGMDDQGMDSVALINRVDEIGGAHGFGRVDMIENRLVGIKSREIYEVPGALAMIMAHRELEDLTLTRDLSHFKRGVEQRLADMIYDGQWFSPLSDALRVFVEESQKNVTGDVRLRFHKGSCLVTGRRSPNSLYQESLATYGTGDIFSHESAQGFVNLWGLPLEVWSRTSRGSA